MVALHVLLLIYVPERRVTARQAHMPLVPGVRRALRNRPFLRLLGPYIADHIPAAIHVVLLPFLIEYVVQPEDWRRALGLLLLAIFGTGLICVPIWAALGRRIGKARAWRYAFLLHAFGSFGVMFVGEGDLLLLVVLASIGGIGHGARFVLPPAMLADVIDYDELHTGKRREAQYAAFWHMVPKFVAIPGAALPLAILGQLGYAPNQPQTEGVVQGIVWLYSLPVGVAGLLAWWLAGRYPIGAREHSAIRAALAERAAEREATDPLTGALLPAARQRTLDEDVALRLDTFSRRELQRVRAAGAGRLSLRVALACAAWLTVAIALGGLTVAVTGDLAQESGLLPPLTIVGAGVALAVALFQAARIGPARRMRAEPIAPELIAEHLRGMPRAPAAARPRPLDAPRPRPA